ncbi:hypothetical protein BATDEDRAFT_18873 [Batrachochytrium dendrobatidis JAM81]|uniref:Post-GPI attachment to proteins factor 3 n=2 Tax=Batrachochytrium dendrobatidis TaxID=109871 RepID=F4NWM1_BATDJ|nr:uncharacterized protein BATDEDRAFT_18873 [Batrachochytrium dendrobatidis JAM81]EGF82507.1 hypothetical protein BATDEDRAFT_18873 [Batrachochytrium dendrobatidis JAM81]KAJ8327990.1 hypothetical protein O5D80_003376 [Batrachochytrium dendrobatidis]KAK5667064.1 hypothetical protein QVD99_006280 [Batrachochytrium dendrobatidis]OAJ39499.1 hypothetical protein BDEG_23338 [Batrachochytrium dendrobatidis JEL423]|eukprot:XP_006676575.1 hypothetical protein BATDEDRAFT_18873 [Batrachochytrium dendrobatidis JAM81]
MGLSNSSSFLLITCVLVLSFLIPELLASYGDQDDRFQLCAAKCINRDCKSTPSTKHLSLILRLMQWDCPQDCRYHCMHLQTQINQQNNEPIEQYYGKWPFVRILGMQEPASVVFSILNGLQHYKGWQKFTRGTKHSHYPYITLMRINGFLAVNSWVWSVIFHTRDFPFTERMDYFSAMASILFSLHLAVVRIFGLRSTRGFIRIILMIVCYCFFIFHIFYLTLFNFDYGYNMFASVIVGVSHTMLWWTWALANWRSRSSYAWKIIVVGLAVSMAMLLELMDFPPLFGLFDAHSLWHAATIPVIPYLWDFYLDDALYIIPIKIP